MPKQIKQPRIRQAANGYYYVHYYDEHTGRGRRESLATADFEEAGHRFQFWKAARTQEQTKDPLISSLLHRYDIGHVDSVGDPDTIRRRIAHLGKHFNDMHLSELQDHVAEYGRFRGVAPSTIRAELACLTAALNYNRKMGVIDAVPHIPMPSASQARDRWLTAGEIDRLIAAAEDGRRGDRLSRAERFIWIALEAPARKRSIERLEWDRVDFDTGMLDFRTPGKRQTKKRQVAIPISDRLLPILERAYEERKGPWVLDNSGNVRKTFETTASRAGLPDITPHTLRHTAATHLARAGTPLWVIAGILGNSLAMVERVYAHQCPGTHRNALNYARG